jgi:flagellar protein FliO/FliZ
MDVLTLALRVVLSLAFVVVLLWYIQRRVSRTQQGARAGDPLVIVSRRGLGQKSSVVVVETDGKRFLLGVTEQSVNVLHTSDAPAPEPDAAPSPGKVFALKLAAATGTEGVVPPVRRRRQRQPSPLDGSVLSPETWKQAGQAIRKGLLG